MLLAETVSASERALEIATTRYREGYADFQRVLDAQRVVFTQADRKLQNDGQHLIAIVAVYKALGGGGVRIRCKTCCPRLPCNRCRIGPTGRSANPAIQDWYNPSRRERPYHGAHPECRTS